MHRFSIAFLLLLLLAAPLVRADHVYKCIAASGETIFQNDPCPSGSTVVAHGSYERQPDDTRNQQQAAAEGRAAAEREQERREAAADSALYEQPEPSASQHMSETARRNAEVEANSYKTRVGHMGRAERQGYPAPDKQTIANPLNGGAPLVVNSGTSEPTAARPAPRSAPTVQMQRPPEPPTMVTDCHGGPAGSVTCYDNKGRQSMGHTDPSGNTDVYSGDGQVKRLPRDACIQDDFGKCKN